MPRKSGIAWQHCPRQLVEDAMEVVTAHLCRMKFSFVYMYSVQAGSLSSFHHSVLPMMHDLIASSVKGKKYVELSQEENN